MLHASGVLFDLTALRNQLRTCANPHRDLLRANLGRPLADIALDWCLILASAALVFEVSVWLAPLAVCVIGNRQRALGNLLHDAGHRNLSRRPWINDLVARVLIAPLLFASMSHYRALHFRHHLALGDARRDPDLLPPPATPVRHWTRTYACNAFTLRAWSGSMAGHFIAPEVTVTSKLGVVAWWGVFLLAMSWFAGVAYVATFAALWLGARASVFHLITVFREMCDHVGLKPGGIFSFTRDMTTHGFWRWVIHPRNNGYHLTHHLCPAVPYYRLPQAHELFRGLPAFRAQAEACDGYFSGSHAVTRTWVAGVAA